MHVWSLIEYLLKCTIDVQKTLVRKLEFKLQKCFHEEAGVNAHCPAKLIVETYFGHKQVASVECYKSQVPMYQSIQQQFHFGKVVPSSSEATICLNLINLAFSKRGEQLPYYNKHQHSPTTTSFLPNKLEGRGL